MKIFKLQAAQSNGMMEHEKQGGGFWGYGKSKGYDKGQPTQADIGICLAADVRQYFSATL